MLESWFQRNQCIRWQMNRLVAVFRRRIMDRRVIGETDVGTMETIPTQHVVQVYDWSSRSKYRFHANTIHSNILAALRYYTMAISMPRKPKNPYTNMEWTTGQMWVLVDQIQRQFWESGHRFIDPALQIYSREFSVDSLRKLYGKQLSVDCARRFFKDRTSDCWDAIYEETLADLFVILKPTRSFFIRSLILERSLKTELLCAWDEMTAAFWCYENLNQLISQNVSSIVDLIENAKRLLASTEVFIRTRRENRMKKKQATS